MSRRQVIIFFQVHQMINREIKTKVSELFFWYNILIWSQEKAAKIAITTVSIVCTTIKDWRTAKYGKRHEGKRALWPL